MIDKLLQDIIQNEVKDNEVAVLLSGGIDSLSIAFSAHRLGKKVHAYTFHLEDEPSYDSKTAINVSKKFNWDIIVIEVPKNNLINDWFILLRKYNCKKKTQFECTFPFLYIIPKINEKFILSGICADGWYGLSKKAMIHFSQTKTKFDQFRYDYFTQENPAGIMQLGMLCNDYNKTLIHPYLWHKTIENFFMKYNHKQLHHKVQKCHVRNAFSNELLKIDKIKPHLNLQLEAKIDKLFEHLLTNKQININNRKRVMDICRDWNK